MGNSEKIHVLGLEPKNNYFLESYALILTV